MSGKIVLMGLILIALWISCIRENANPFSPESAVQELLVDTGFTNGCYGILGYQHGEFSSFTLRWTETDNAQFYQIRVSDREITVANWNDAEVAATVSAPADSAEVFTFVKVNKEPCIGCGICEQACPMNAIAVESGTAVVDNNLCTACGQCQILCPVNAIDGINYAHSYFFAVRPFTDEDTPGPEIAVSSDAYRIIYSNYHNYIFGPLSPFCSSCGLCSNYNEDSLGITGGCHIINEYTDESREHWTGSGCPFDAFWQDTLPVGSLMNMLYIDYEKCTSCGQCFLECWNYNNMFDAGPQPYHGMLSIKRRVVPSGWIDSSPARPR